MSMTEKEKIAQVLADSRDALRLLSAERDELKEKLAEATNQLGEVRTRLEAEKLAAEMVEKGLKSSDEFTGLVDEIEKAAHDGRLPVLQEAVKLAAADMGAHFTINQDEASGSGLTELEQYLVGSVG